MTKHNRTAPVAGSDPPIMSRLKGILVHHYGDIGALGASRLVLAKYTAGKPVGVATWHNHRKGVWVCVWANGAASGHRAFHTEADATEFHDRKTKLLKIKGEK